MRGANTLSLYDWETVRLVRRIDIDARNVVWSEAGTLMAVISADSVFVLKYNREVQTVLLVSVVSDGCVLTFLL